MMAGTKNWTAFILMILGSCGCDNPSHNQTTLDFSYNDTFQSAFSMKIDSRTDTVYLNLDFVKGGQSALGTYYAIASRAVIDSVLAHTEKVMKSFVDSSYRDEFLADGLDYKICIQNHGTQCCIRVHTTDAPEQLDRFASYMLKVKEGLKYKKLDREIHFASADILPNPPKMDSVKFLPPQ